MIDDDDDDDDDELMMVVVLVISLSLRHTMSATSWEIWSVFELVFSCPSYGSSTPSH